MPASMLKYKDMKVKIIKIVALPESCRERVGSLRASCRLLHI